MSSPDMLALLLTGDGRMEVIYQVATDGPDVQNPPPGGWLTTANLPSRFLNKDSSHLHRQLDGSNISSRQQPSHAPSTTMSPSYWSLAPALISSGPSKPDLPLGRGLDSSFHKGMGVPVDHATTSDDGMATREEGVLLGADSSGPSLASCAIRASNPSADFRVLQRPRPPDDMNVFLEMARAQARWRRQPKPLGDMNILLEAARDGASWGRQPKPLDDMDRMLEAARDGASWGR